ncbi:MAG: hypothetical protein WC924_05885 [Candidatus Gracilibacteria bacterium]
MSNAYLDGNRAGLILGTFVGGLHLVWSLLVAANWAQPLMDFIFRMHFLSNPYELSTFNLGMASLLVIITFVVGYVCGLVLSFLWNKLMRR